MSAAYCRRLQLFVDWLGREKFRLVVYAAMEAVALMTNFGTNSFTRSLDAPLIVATPVAYFVGGQTKFWLHNSVTWRDHHPTLEGVGRRWLLFIAGNLFGLVLNSAALMSYIAMGMPFTAAFVLAICTSWIWNTAWNWLKVFGKSRPLEPHTQEEDQL